MKFIDYLRSYIRVLVGKIGLLPQVPRPISGGSLRLVDGCFQIDRRRETRSPRISPCTYGLMRSKDRDGGVLEEGYGIAVDDSSTGMKLLLRVAPVEGQIVEIQTDHVTLGRAISLVEVCWTKLLDRDEGDVLYLVGCRVSFGPMRASGDLATMRI